MEELDERALRHRAAEARRLISEPLFVEALEKIRISTLSALEDVDATNVAAVQKLQAKAKVTYEIVLELQGIIAADPHAQDPTANATPETDD